MPDFTDTLTDRLTSLLDAVPDVVDVIELAPPDLGAVQQRAAGLLRSAADVAGKAVGDLKLETQQTRTLLSGPGGVRAVGFHASGAMTVSLGLEPFADIFGDDPGDQALGELVERSAASPGLSSLIPADDDLRFERLWRIKAAGGDRAGRITSPVLCRAVGAFRQVTRDLPVYGRATATVELAAKGKLSGVSVSARRLADDKAGDTLDRVKVRAPGDAAGDIVGQLVKSFGGRSPQDVRVTPEWFRFGYLSLGRRRPQGVLAPFYVAAVGVEHEQEATAHILVAAGSAQRYLRLPTGQSAAARSRPAAA
jgi:hypothetical protein